MASVDARTGRRFRLTQREGLRDDSNKGLPDGDPVSASLTSFINSEVVNMMKAKGLAEMAVSNGNGKIYHSANAFMGAEKLLVIIQGTGRVRAGAWSIGVCAFRGTWDGTVEQWIDIARSRGMEIIVLNPNDPQAADFRGKPYSGEDKMVCHTLGVFDGKIIPSDPKKVWIVAHSAGGYCTTSLLEYFPEWSMQHIMAIAMTDACESMRFAPNSPLKPWCFNNIINWVCSDKPKDSPLPDGCASKHKSAGTTVHELSTPWVFSSVWEFFSTKGA